MNHIKESPAVTIRQPATANLMIDSADRNVGASANLFSITRPQALLNGFFTRIATTELVLDWGVPNIAPELSNNFWQVDLSGAGAATGSGSNFGDVSGGFYNVEAWADQTLAILNAAGALTTPATTWVLGNPRPGFVTFTPNQPVFIRIPSIGWFEFGRLSTPFLPGPPPFAPWVYIDPAGVNNAPKNLSIGGGTIFYTSGGGGPNPFLHPQSPTMDLRAIRYLDFISAQLTYNQDLKDASTARIVRDVLARWYMAYDNQVRVDAYGFPIYMGYEPFSLRRLFNPPKQIRWDNIQPVGNLSFEVYTDTGTLAPMRFSNWLMTLQVSED